MFFYLSKLGDEVVPQVYRCNRDIFIGFQSLSNGECSIILHTKQNNKDPKTVLKNIVVDFLPVFH